MAKPFASTVLLTMLATLVAWSCTTNDPDASTFAQLGSATPTIAPVATFDRSGSELVARPQGVIVHDTLGPFFLDPLVASRNVSFPYSEVFSGLVRIGSDPYGLPEPEIASSWTVSDDGLRYTFNLRDGIKFSDGSPITASDVKFSWERALRPESLTQQAYEVLGAIEGAEAVRTGRTTGLSGVEVVDSSTLSVDLTRPRSQFVSSLVTPEVSILSEDNVRSWGTLNWIGFLRSGGFGGFGELQFDELPIGAGPFRIAAYEYQGAGRLEPNPHYWRGVPNLAEIRIVDLYFAEDGTTFQSPALRDFDILHADQQSHESVNAGRPQIWDGESIGIFDAIAAPGVPHLSLLAFNTAIPPLDDVELRRALYHAADRTRPSDVRIPTVPAERAQGLLPPRFPGYREATILIEPNQKLAVAHLERTETDEIEASRTLRFTGDGAWPYWGFTSQFTENWIDWLGLEIHGGDDDDAPFGEEHAMMQAGTLQMQYVYVKPRYPDPCAILCRIPDLFGPNAQSEETRELRAMLDDAAATADRAARIAKYQAIEDHILDRALVIPVFWDDGVTYRLVKPYISGYKVPAYGGSMYEDVVVDTTHPDYPQERLSDGWAR